MKYKKCPVCGKYNKHTKQSCFCGADISNVFDYVSMSEEEAVKANESALPPKEPGETTVLSTEKHDIRICEECGAANDVDAMNCKKCGALFIDTGHKAERRKDNIEEAQGSISKDCLPFHVVYAEKTFPFVATKDKQFFGRENLSLPSFQGDHYISRKHIAYFYEGGYLYIVDVSTNGTFLNGAKLQRDVPVRVRSGDRISLYRQSIQIVYAG